VTVSASQSQKVNSTFSIIPTMQLTEVMLLQLQMNQCRNEQTSLMRQRNNCLVEKEACINSTLISYVKNNDNILVIDSLRKDQDVILGILLFVLLVSLGTNIWCCILCLRKCKRNSPQKLKIEYWVKHAKHLREIVAAKGKPQETPIDPAELTISTSGDGTLIVEGQGKA
jgi:hypothetical protein